VLSFPIGYGRKLVMQTKYNIILSQEVWFARAVALRMIMGRPLSVWHYMIPFVFVFDFLRRKKETETFSKNFLFTKKLALDAAYDINQGEDRQNRLAMIEDQIRDRLTAQKLYSWGIYQGQMAEVNLLIDHYLKLLKAEGERYQSLVKDAYKTRDNYQAFLHQLTSAEKEIDRAVIKTLGETEEIWESMLAKQTVVDEMRTRGVDKVF